MSLRERLLAGLPTGMPTDGTCWEWLEGTDHEYGRIDHDGKALRANRVAYEAFIGPIPDGQVVRHTCDNPPCCNPAHLVDGTMKDNTGDMLERGRDCHGSAHPFARLTERDVMDMRAKRAEGVSLKALSREYAISTATASDVVRGKTWRHVINVSEAIS
jgi:hypothetical protein